MSKSDKCPDCGVAIGVAHEGGCDVARCLACGMQRIGCDCASPGDDVWTGEWPGNVAARRHGFFCRWKRGGGWQACGPDDEGAVPDVNTLMVRCRWNARTHDWDLRDDDFSTWARTYRHTLDAASRDKVEAMFRPMIRVALSSDLGQAALISWVRRTLPDLNEIEQAESDVHLARMLYDAIVTRLRP